MITVVEGHGASQCVQLIDEEDGDGVDQILFIELTDVKESLGGTRGGLCPTSGGCRKDPVVVEEPLVNIDPVYGGQGTGRSFTLYHPADRFMKSTATIEEGMMQRVAAQIIQ
jgi:hypothetical protein